MLRDDVWGQIANFFGKSPQSFERSDFDVSFHQV
jgi:hypothetical protein